MSLPIHGINTDPVRQEFLEAASRRDADKLEKMLAEHGDDLVSTYGKVEHSFSSFIQPFESEGNALHQIGVGRIHPESDDAFSLDLLFNRALRHQHAAAEGKKLTRCVKLLVDHGCDVNRAGSRGWTPLHQVVSDIRGEIPLSDIYDSADMLLKKGANPLVFTDDGRSPLDACRDEDLRRALGLKFGIVVPGYKAKEQEIGGKKKNMAELRQAIATHDLEAVDEVLAKGLDLTDNSRNSPLVLAVVLGKQGILEKLVEAGADLHQIFDFEKDGKIQRSNLLSMAWIMNKSDTFKYLLDQGLDPNVELANSDELAASPSQRLWHALVLFGDVPYMRAVLETFPESLDFQTPGGRSILEYLRADRPDELKAECEGYAKTYVSRMESKQEEMKAFQDQLRVFEAFEALENIPSLEEARNVYFKKMAEAEEGGLDKETMKELLKGREALGPLMEVAKKMLEKGHRWVGLFKDGPTPPHDLIRSWLEAYASKDTSSSWRDQLKALLETSKENATEEPRPTRQIFQKKSRFAKALDSALEAGDYDALQELLQSHPMFADLVNQIPLVTKAAELGHWDLVKKMVESGASPNERYDPDEMVTPLHLALRAGCDEVVDLLVKHGADKAAIDDTGLNMMHYAARSGNKGLCERVAGWDYLKDFEAPQYFKFIPEAFYAAASGDEECLNYLLDNPPSREYWKHYKADRDDGSWHVVPDPLKHHSAEGTILHSAVKGGNLAMVRELLDRGVDPTLINGTFATCLHIAASHGDFEMVKLLYPIMKQKGFGIDDHPQNGTVLELAVRRSNNLEMVKYLIEQGASPDEKGHHTRRSLRERLVGDYEVPESIREYLKSLAVV